MKILHFLFSFKGRVGRMGFWLFVLTLLFSSLTAWAVPAAIAKINYSPIADAEVYRIANRVLLGWALVALVPVLAVSSKRLHDRNRSTRVLWLLLAAVVLHSSLMLGWLVPWGNPLQDLSKMLLVLALTVLSLPLGLVPFSIYNIAAAVRKINDDHIYYIAMIDIGLLTLAFGAWLLFETGFRRGTQGANRYGPDPRKPRKANKARPAESLSLPIGGPQA